MDIIYDEKYEYLLLELLNTKKNLDPKELYERIPKRYRRSEYAFYDIHNRLDCVDR